jgi:NAD(P)-dependent dehydrogenase (short-subunit alcohol dehydrogenase family)
LLTSHLVLINNAGAMDFTPKTTLDDIRAFFNTMLNLHVSSVAVMTHAFQPLLYKSRSPKVINVTSGLGSITNTLSPDRRMFRVPGYAASKVGMNGLTAHLQAGENDRVADLKKKGEHDGKSYIRFFISNPGVMKTAFSRFHEKAKAPQLGAESIVRLLADENGKYNDWMQWEFEQGEMRKVPW